MKIGAIIVAAGRGERLGGSRPKCFIRIQGAPLFALAAWPFQLADRVEAVVLVVPSGLEEEAAVESGRWGLTKVIATVAGGAERSDSVRNGLTALPAQLDGVLIHDGARPLLSVHTLNQTITALETALAVTVAVPVTDTLHLREDGRLKAGPDRNYLVAAQTPQGFHRHILEAAFRKAETMDVHASDEICLVRWTLLQDAILVKGELSNIKITHQEDIHFYKSQMSARVKQMKGSSIAV
ncbi:MAG: 2-C-methyl-D-erythritol 4-phosphate cytidylyltransferase [Calditrichota bacterium]